MSVVNERIKKAIAANEHVLVTYPRKRGKTRLVVELANDGCIDVIVTTGTMSVRLVQERIQNPEIKVLPWHSLEESELEGKRVAFDEVFFMGETVWECIESRKDLGTLVTGTPLAPLDDEIKDKFDLLATYQLEVDV